MNIISNHKSFTVFLITFLLVALSIVVPVYATLESSSNKTRILLTKNQICSILHQKLCLHDRNEYSLEKIHSYFVEKQTTPLFYIAQLKPTGFIIITSDLSLPPILSYSFTSNVDTHSKEYSMFTNFIKTDILSRLQKLQSFGPADNYIDEWQLLLNNKNIEPSLSFEQWPPAGYSTTEGWIETRWHQKSPFNNLCPIDLSSGHRSLAGCPAVAMGQILNYHQTLNDVSFNDTDDYIHNYGQYFQIDDEHETYGFPSFSELNNYLNTVQIHFTQNADLTDTDKAALIFACGTAAKQVYTPQVSGTFGVSQAFEAYQKFNCEESVLLTSEDEDIYNRIIQNIKTGLPVHFAIVDETITTGHNLIIDGYNTNDYYHLNFGWDGAYDGWYDIPDELPYELNYIEGVIVDILPPTGAANLEASGSIQLSDVTPGTIVTDMFAIKNTGDNDSELAWEIESHPDWGIWEFSQIQGNGLTPEEKEEFIKVNVTIPSQKAKTFTGGIKVINKDDPTDFTVIPISITTLITKQGSMLSFLLNYMQGRHPLLFEIINKIIF